MICCVLSIVAPLQSQPDIYTHPTGTSPLCKLRNLHKRDKGFVFRFLDAGLEDCYPVGFFLGAGN